MNEEAKSPVKEKKINVCINAIRSNLLNASEMTSAINCDLDRVAYREAKKSDSDQKEKPSPELSNMTEVLENILRISEELRLEISELRERTNSLF